MSSSGGSVFKKKMTAPIKHQKVVLPSACTGENSLVLDFAPFETILQWKRMLECDIFVGARYFELIHKLHIYSDGISCEHSFSNLFSGEANTQQLHIKMPFMYLVVIMAKAC